MPPVHPLPLPPTTVMLLSDVTDISVFEHLAFGHPLNDSERKEKLKRADADAMLARTLKEPIEIQHHFEKAILHAAAGDKRHAYNALGKALEAGTKGTSSDLWAAFTACWPLAAFLVKTTTGSDPAPIVYLGEWIRFLDAVRQDASDPRMKDTAHFVLGTFKLMQLLEVGKLTHPDTQPEYARLARGEARALDAATRGAFAFTYWAKSRLEDYGFEGR